MATEDLNLQSVVGRRTRDLRTAAGMTHSELAAYMRGLGFKWDESRGVKWESGLIPVRLDILLALRMALASRFPNGAILSIADFVPNEAGPGIELFPGVTIPGREVRGMILGENTIPGESMHPALHEAPVPVDSEAEILLDPEAWRAPYRSQGVGANLAEFTDIPQLLTPAERRKFAGPDWSAEQVRPLIAGRTLTDERMARDLRVHVLQFFNASLALWGTDFGSEFRSRLAPGLMEWDGGPIIAAMLDELRAHMKQTSEAGGAARSRSTVTRSRKAKPSE